MRDLAASLQRPRKTARLKDNQAEQTRNIHNDLAITRRRIPDTSVKMQQQIRNGPGQGLSADDKLDNSCKIELRISGLSGLQ
jgi:hypothetical protein